MKNSNTNDNQEEIDDTDEGFDELYTELDDNRRAELDPLLGLKILGLEIWDESLGDENESEPVKPEDRVFFDCDLLLEDSVALELYVSTVYPDPDADPVAGMDQIFDAVGRLADDGMELLDYDQADEEGGIALAFGHGEKSELILVASAWMFSEWEPDESPEDESEE